ncbi:MULTISPECIES: type IV secretory system conjugative DNA transfer family protein [unclassified Mesorhizobium]|uniref:type IV secretory system conjugative DNA transfer family protein n=1 Tax=unclassified Mesorhizobium TaxID=325217 RepID=UPI002417C1DA|nr:MULTISPECIES: type IV secretory system conjugative DNA transfer family protein [unclassified Mesorhizobium]MDG4901418.1 type IV secretory system conjugative DNA transfer family protein [Mesorhizobium sp. WSM4962]
MAGIGGFFLIVLLGWRFDGKKSDAYGSAQWSSVWKPFRKRMFDKRGLRVGEWTGRLGVYYDATHAITFGHSGSGKGVSAILPNLLSYPWFFLIDPGGENTAIAVKHWRKRKMRFACINIFGMFPEEPWTLPAHGFNPLDFLDVSSAGFAADALIFSEMLTPRTGTEGGSNTYFKDASQSAKQAFIIHIKTTEPKARQNLATLYEYVNSDAKGWKALLTAMKANPACSGLVGQMAIRLARIANESPPEFSAILSTIQQDLSFLADPLVREKLSCSDVDFSILKGLEHGQTGGIVSVVLPLEYMESHAAIPRLALACGVLAMQRKPLARNKVVFLIDEAATLGRVLRFPNWLATLRKYRVVIWTIWQNIGQLSDLYGRGWQTLVANCGLVQILGVGDTETAKHTEELLGKCTIKVVSTNGRGERSTSETSRPLRMADELRRLEEDEQIDFIGNLLPMKLKKVLVWQRPDLAGRFNRNPYFDDDAPGVSAADEMAAAWGRIYYALVWLMAPHPVAACLILVAIFLFALSMCSGGR